MLIIFSTRRVPWRTGFHTANSFVSFLSCFLSLITRSQTTGVSHVANGARVCIEITASSSFAFQALLNASYGFCRLGGLLTFPLAWKVVAPGAEACPDYWLETRFDELAQDGQPFTLNFTLDSSSSKQLRSSSGFLQGRPMPSVLCGNTLAFFQMMNGMDREH